MSVNRKCAGIWFPIEIWEMKELSFIEKGLLLEIQSLDCSEKHCFASNVHFMEFFNCSESTIRRSLKKLSELGLVKILNGSSKKRALISLFPRANVGIEPSHEPSQNDWVTQSKCLGQPSQNEQHNNTSNNNTINNSHTPALARFDEVDWVNNNIDIDLHKAFIEFLKIRKSIKAKNSEYALKLLKNELYKYDAEDRVSIIEQSIKNSWKDLFPLKNKEIINHGNTKRYFAPSAADRHAAVCKQFKNFIIAKISEAEERESSERLGVMENEQSF